MSKERARKIKVLLFDVDGVLTDGTIFLFPAPAGAAQSVQQRTGDLADKGGYAIHSTSVIEAKGFHAHDGTAISLARLGGLKTGVVTKRVSETVALRARDLKLDYVYQGAADKAAVLDEILKAEGITDDEIAYVGDDIIDLPVMRRCGLAIAVGNARKDVKAVAHYVTERDGGKGAGRDAVEYILAAQDKLEWAVEEYLTVRSPAVPDKK